MNKILPMNSNENTNSGEPDNNTIDIPELVTVSEHIQKRKRIWIIPCIIVVILIILIIVVVPITIVIKNKINTTKSTIVTTTTTTTFAIETSTIETTSKTIINTNTLWKLIGIVVAGGNGIGNRTNQLNRPFGMDIDHDDRSIYIADAANNRIVRWKINATDGEIVAGGNNLENKINRLYYPTDVVIDKKNNSLIICDYGNHRIIRWFLHYPTNPQIIISNIPCFCIALDHNDALYADDRNTKEIKQWKKDESNFIVVAGGKNEETGLNILESPNSLFIDENCSIYVTDGGNYHVMKWIKDIKEGIIIHNRRDSQDRFNPHGLIVDSLRNIYVSDSSAKVFRLSEESQERSIIIGEYGPGEYPYQLYNPKDILFDQQGNLYVVDPSNSRVLRFDIDDDE